MAPGPKTGPALFLGLELATDQLRASIVDESLELVGVECVDFDTELPEYQTQGGIFTTPGDAYTTPVDMWVKALVTTCAGTLFICLLNTTCLLNSCQQQTFARKIDSES
jgi:sugar (pentulose or hexulose) kinase